MSQNNQDKPLWFEIVRLVLSFLTILSTVFIGFFAVSIL